MRVSCRVVMLAVSVLLTTGIAGCSDLLGPEDPRYEAECIVYVAGDATRAEIKQEINRQLTDDQRARCRPPHVRMVTFG